MTQVDFKGWSFGPGIGAAGEAGNLFLRLRDSVEDASSGMASRLTSDLGAPNDANAPDPRPKADEAFVDGEETPPERGEMALKGLDRPCELSGKRFEE